MTQEQTNKIGNLIHKLAKVSLIWPHSHRQQAKQQGRPTACLQRKVNTTMAKTSAETLQELQVLQFDLDAALSDAKGDTRAELYRSFLSDVSALTSSFSLPSLSPSWSWFNVSSALTADHFLGRVTVLDFFTYCCVNCLHILPDLHRVEER
jgi:hypothetical protein